MPRLLRQQKKALTRNGLLETARKVFTEQGYHKTTLDQVADAAGFSKGAVYSNFKSKDDLFLALLDELMEERLHELAADLAVAQRGSDFIGDLARRASRHRMKLAPKWTLLLMEFWTHAAREPEIRREFATRHTRLMENVAQRVTDAAAQRGIALRRPMIDVIRALSAIGHGMALEQLIDPGSVEEEFLAELLALIYRDSAIALKPNPRPSGSHGHEQSIADLQETQQSAHVEGEP
ncbi:MAG: TetR/AcrR family transcriptional regulator [Acidobacteria bacterium]|nr:TetR/AcrR family transcriptional regulator [Acidobacteriota bacterium]